MKTFGKLEEKLFTIFVSNDLITTDFELPSCEVTKKVTEKKFRTFPLNGARKNSVQSDS